LLRRGRARHQLVSCLPTSEAAAVASSCWPAAALHEAGRKRSTRPRALRLVVAAAMVRRWCRTRLAASAGETKLAPDERRAAARRGGLKVAGVDAHVRFAGFFFFFFCEGVVFIFLFLLCVVVCGFSVVVFFFFFCFYFLCCVVFFFCVCGFGPRGPHAGIGHSMFVWGLRVL